MREVQSEAITRTIARLFIEANYCLPDDLLEAIKNAAQSEVSPLARDVLDQIIKNAEIAVRDEIPLCQDCGVAVVFLEIGQNVQIVGKPLEVAINEGVKQAYVEGYLRKSMVNRPFTNRINTGNNTPAIIHADIVPGDEIKIRVMAKGGGAENMSRLIMLSPSDGREGLVQAVMQSVKKAGPNACGPLIVGVGIGGTAEKALLLAKKALFRKIGEHNPDPEAAELEMELYQRVNDLGIGPMGYGGKTTALAINVELFPAHIASLPLAINLNCHSSRHKEALI